jgi:hypothetical protein
MFSREKKKHPRLKPSLNANHSEAFNLFMGPLFIHWLHSWLICRLKCTVHHFIKTGEIILYIAPASRRVPSYVGHPVVSNRYKAWQTSAILYMLRKLPNTSAHWLPSLKHLTLSDVLSLLLPLLVCTTHFMNRTTRSVCSEDSLKDS